MTLWDGFLSEKAARVVIVGATNRPADVDRAILRRMPLALHIDVPVCVCVDLYECCEPLAFFPIPS